MQLKPLCHCLVEVYFTIGKKTAIVVLCGLGWCRRTRSCGWARCTVSATAWWRSTSPPCWVSTPPPWTLGTRSTCCTSQRLSSGLSFCLQKNARDSVGSASIGEILKCTNHGSRSESTGIWHTRIVIYKNLAWGENFLIRNYSSSGLVQNKSRIRIEFYASLLPALGLLGVGQWMEGDRPLWICVFVVKKIIDILHLLWFFLDSKNKDCTTNYSSEN